MFLIAIVLGIVEGLTEFLPVSSTGHLIVAGHLLGYTGDKADSFEIFIQAGAILAVVWEYRARLRSLFGRAWQARTQLEDPALSFVLKVGLAFLPAAGVGFLVHKQIKALLFSPFTVALALIVGGVVMYGLERFLKPRDAQPTESLTWKQALGVGLFQILSLFPGVSRSASTIMGGMVLGLDRRAATDFSFYLALPTLGIATVYELLTNLEQFSADDILPYGLGVLVSFASALVVIRVLLAYVRTHDFKPLALYRIVAGCAILAILGT